MYAMKEKNNRNIFRMEANAGGKYHGDPAIDRMIEEFTKKTSNPENINKKGFFDEAVKEAMDFLKEYGMKSKKEN